MKNLRITHSPFVFASMISVVLCWAQFLVEAQTHLPDYQLPSGEITLGNLFTGNQNIGFYTSNHSYSITTASVLPQVGKILWTPLVGSEIKKNFPKISYSPKKVYLDILVTKDGQRSIYVNTYSDGELDNDEEIDEVGLSPVLNVNVITGDDLYAIMGDGSVYVTHNDTTWHIDTSGLKGAFANDGALDSLQNVYLATSSGIMKQARGGSQWQMQTTGYFPHVYVSRDNRIFAVGYGSLLVSTNLGSSWSPDTYPGPATSTIKKLTDDSTGAIYALVNDYMNGDQIWHQKKGGSWQQLGKVASLSADPTTSFINDISVDSGIYIATNFGEFFSGDNGVTWTPINNGVPASNIYSFFELSSGRKFTTTSLGLFSKDPSDTIWTKRCPPNSYLGKLQVTEDN
ncbi:MAG: WD40/YVTN/BNR-like repeat-containing protein, partial [Candidatus Kapaibacterium sp.]